MEDENGAVVMTAPKHIYFGLICVVVEFIWEYIIAAWHLLFSAGIDRRMMQYKLFPCEKL